MVLLHTHLLSIRIDERSCPVSFSVECFLGFSFTGEVRQPFVSAIEALKGTRLPIISGTEFRPHS